MTDQELVRQLKSGGPEAFQEMYDRFFDPLYRFCHHRTGNHHPDTEDVVGETFMTAVRKIDELSDAEGTKVFNWLASIARFKLLELYRKRNRQEMERHFSSFDDALEDVLEGRAAETDEEPEGAFTPQSVGVVLSSLPDDYQRVLSDKYLKGLSVKEMSQRIGKSDKAVESLLTRARDAFRRAHASIHTELRLS